MHIFKAGLLAVSFIASWTISTSANAALSASASVSNLRYELYDLNVNDAISVSISFDASPLSAANWSEIYSEADGSWPLISSQYNTFPTSSAISASSNAFASIANTTDWIGNSYSVSSYTEAGSDESSAGRVDHSINFVLGVGTGVRWYADSFVEASTSTSTLPQHYSIGRTHLAIDGSIGDSADHVAYAFSSFTQSSSKALTNYVANAGSVDRSFNLTVYLVANSQSIVPVPEPETYALMLAGLGLMGAVARRRRSKQA